MLFKLSDDSPNHIHSSKHASSSAVLRSLQVNVGPDGEETRAQTVQKPPDLLPSPDTSTLLQDLQPGDNTSFILLNLTRTGNYHVDRSVSTIKKQDIIFEIHCFEKYGEIFHIKHCGAVYV